MFPSPPYVLSALEDRAAVVGMLLAFVHQSPSLSSSRMITSLHYH